MESTVSSATITGELQSRSIDALVSLLKALDSLNGMDEVVRHALLIVSGQLLVKRAAVFVLEDGDNLRLQSVVGFGRKKIDLENWDLSPSCHELLRTCGVIKLQHDGTVPDIIADSFEHIAHLVNGDLTVGLLLLGGSLGKHSFDDQDRRLIETMGAVIGTVMHRVQVHEQLIEARRRNDEVDAIRKSVMDHVSHEFNTPLMVVKSTGEMMRLASESEREELLDMHEEAVQRLEYLVKSIVRVTSESTATGSPDALPVTMLVGAIIRPWIDRETDDHCCFVVEQVDPRVYVAVDPMRMEIILKELYCNAREALRDQARWIVIHLYCAPAGWWSNQDHTKRLESYHQRLGDQAELESILWADDPPRVVVADEDTEVVLEMIDLGIGIPEGECELVFEPFSQARNSPSLGISGAGLGLPTCDKLARELGGKMAVQSTEGLGSVFAVVLPGLRG